MKASFFLQKDGSVMEKIFGNKQSIKYRDNINCQKNR